MDQVFDKHQNSTFSGKNVLLRMSPLGSYIAIEFLFRMNNGQGQPMTVMPSVSGSPQIQMNMFQPQAQAKTQLGNGFEINNQPQPYNQANQNAPIF